jgi:hypothetical protein
MTFDIDMNNLVEIERDPAPILPSYAGVDAENFPASEWRSVNGYLASSPLPYCGRCDMGFITTPSEVSGRAPTSRLCPHCERPRRALKRIERAKLPAVAGQHTLATLTSGIARLRGSASVRCSIGSPRLATLTQASALLCSCMAHLATARAPCFISSPNTPALRASALCSSPMRVCSSTSRHHGTSPVRSTLSMQRVTVSTTLTCSALMNSVASVAQALSGLIGTRIRQESSSALSMTGGARGSSLWSPPPTSTQRRSSVVSSRATGPSPQGCAQCSAHLSR